MIKLPVYSLDLLVEESYKEAKNLHGDLAISLEGFRHQLLTVMQRHMKQGEAELQGDTLFKRLHTNDLYLAFACSQANEAAWRRFSSLYHKSVYDAAFFVCRDHIQADEMARGVLGHLFLPDSKGVSRITSYQGLSTLVAWLRVITTHEAINEIRFKNRHSEDVDNLVEVADTRGSQGAQRALRKTKYESLIHAVFEEVPCVLSEQEKLILVLRYRHGFKMCDIARRVGTSQSNLTCRLKRAQKKIRQGAIAILRKRYRLREAAIKECIEEIIDNPVYSLLDFISISGNHGQVATCDLGTDDAEMLALSRDRS